MQFLLLGYDAKDADAPARRQAARPGHLEKVKELKANGNAIMGAALLDDDGNMIGSSMILEFPSRVEMDDWLENEPYIKGKVWDRIEITVCEVAPSFK
jgi:uncharacterized protein YciI